MGYLYLYKPRRYYGLSSRLTGSTKLVFIVIWHVEQLSFSEHLGLNESEQYYSEEYYFLFVLWSKTFTSNIDTFLLIRRKIS